MVGGVTEIVTERLGLRRFVETDRQAVVDIHRDPETNRYNPHPPDTATTLVMFDSWLEHWATFGYGYLAVRERGRPAATDGSDVIGMTGVRNREFRGEKVLNLAYRFRPSAWGKGYAAEAARAAVEWAEREMSAVPVLISVSVTNTPSLRVVEKLGFREYVEEEYEGAVSRHFRR
ncbi:N-acetyltransferase [Amycolatopsis sp. AA4]|uniref:GNAT family N-acetyltransferase n=1 Tax=Amycolatopsis sp. AA4 TaxID=1896961 RepID=UPI0001B58BD1|nr:GNAT family N-acetyltransferase [Amycolatopsis sp. AA4]ATY14376.1 N-acetyltransferase [Amycolatopsis sp. AA4]